MRLGREVVNGLLLGGGSDGRLVHDSPIRGDVWAAFAASPDQPIDLLVEVYRDAPSGLVASRLARRLYNTHQTHEPPEAGFGISYLEGFVAARLNLQQVAMEILPYTGWARDLKRSTSGIELAPALYHEILAQLRSLRRTDPAPVRDLDRLPSVSRLAGTMRVLAALAWAAEPGLAEQTSAADARQRVERLDDFLFEADLEAIAASGSSLGDWIVSQVPADDASPDDHQSEATDVFAVSRNRPVELAIERSVPAIKADAATTLFSVSCQRIGWAVLDTGIDGSHPAFRKTAGQPDSRIVATYDFTRLRQIALVDYIYNPALLTSRSREVAAQTGLRVDAVRSDMLALSRNAQDQRPMDWTIASRYVVLTDPPRPASAHGTHVAGILGANWFEADLTASPTSARRGVCPDISLYDFRVVGGSAEDTEFALMAALQFIRHLNSRNNHPRIHGANVSLSIRHDVRNYACGQTPVCDEARRTVESGVVVVAAAGNRGYQSYHLSDGGAFETYAPSSITDPGNTEAVITVGATHRSAPHSYGVSFFSSRGPTGDGRQKPDLVAPGEKIWSVVPGSEEDTMSGTSMSAPHVSGAAAMLMARNPEFIGRPAEIKSILVSSCTDLGRERSFQGAGMLDILRAMQTI